MPHDPSPGILDMDVEYRTFEMSDTPDFVRLIDEAFGYGFLFPDPDILHAYYLESLAGLVAGSTFSEVAVVDDSVAGICFCATAYAPHAFKGFEPRMHALMASERFRWLCENRDPSSLQRKKTIDRNVSRVVSKIERCDGDIQFLVVSRDRKGMGIGGRLLRDMLAHMSEWRASRVLVLTDDLSDRGFYDHAGFSCVSSGKAVFDNGASLVTYAYVRDLRPLLF